MQQLSDEWFKARAKISITGSMVGAILLDEKGKTLSPFMSYEDALRMKVRDRLGAESEFSGNIATRWGQDNEDKAKAEYEKITGNLVFDAGFFIHPHITFLGASPDGLVDRDGLIEIKCPFSKVVKPLSEQPHYYAQIQLQLHVTGRKWCDFFVWTPEKTHLERVNIDKSWLDINYCAFEDFDRHLKAIVSDPSKHGPYLENPIQERTDEEWLNLERRYVAACEEEEEAKEKKEQIRQQLIELAKEKKCRGAALFVYPSTRKGSIAYAKAVAELLPDADLERYRGKPLVTWTIKQKEM